MKPLLALRVSFVLALAAPKVMYNHFEPSLAGRLAMAVMLRFTPVGHFAFTKGMEMMVPDFVPFKKALIYLTGVIEICAAAGLLIPDLKVATGWLLILFFILLLPANINAAVRHIDYQKSTTEGAGCPTYGSGFRRSFCLFCGLIFLR